MRRKDKATQALLNALWVEAENEQDAADILAARYKRHTGEAAPWETWEGFDTWARATLPVWGWAVVADNRMHPLAWCGGPKWSVAILRTYTECEECEGHHGWGLNALDGDGYNF